MKFISKKMKNQPVLHFQKKPKDIFIASILW